MFIYILLRAAHIQVGYTVNVPTLHSRTLVLADWNPRTGLYIFIFGRVGR